MFYSFKKSSKTDALMAIAAASAVLISGLAMSHLSATYPNFAGLTAPAFGLAGGAEIVSQAAIAPDARNDMPAVAAAACPISLDLLDEGNASIGGTLLAPCLPSQDLVIAHEGLVISARTLASGALFFSLPALKHPATVDVRFTSGDTATASLDIPDANAAQRVAVQWPLKDGFTLHAFQDGAEFDDAGHIWAENANTPALGAAPKGGYMTLLGDAGVETPLMAQVFTFGQTARTEVDLEAAVTAANCGSELMGEVITAKGGAVQKSDLTLAMPSCEAVGEYVYFGAVPMPMDLALAQ